MIRLLPGLLVLVALVALVARSAAAEEKKATPKPEGTSFQMSKEEQTLLELTNEERAKAKRPPLKANPVLCKVARAHSANMAKQEKMEHVLDGKTPGQRVLAAGYDYGKVSENIATSESVKTPLTTIMKAWMESETHRKNLLSDRVTEIGLGLATNGKGEVYFTQVFARPRNPVKRP